MAGRERMRIILCEAVSLQPLGSNCTKEKILLAFRQVVHANYGDLGLGTFGASAKCVINLTEFCGLFAIRVTSTQSSEAQACLSLILCINSKPVTVRVLHVSGRMKNTVKVTIDRLIIWRNNLPPGYALPRKALIEETVRNAITSLNSLPSYV